MKLLCNDHKSSSADLEYLQKTKMFSIGGQFSKSLGGQILAPLDTRFACQLKSLLFQHGLIQADDKKKVSEKWAKVLEAMPFSSGLKYAIVNYLTQWRQMNAKIKEIDKELAVQAEKDGAIEMMYRQHEFLCLERATIAEWQGASEDQKFVAKPTQSNMNLFFWNAIIALA